jgi:hypothetical protein
MRLWQSNKAASQHKDGSTYGFVIYDEANRPSLYLGFASVVEADKAAREA